MPAPCTILLNPNARSVDPNAGAETVRAMAREVGLEAEVLLPESKDEMIRAVRRLVAEKAPMVAIGGGDGTVKYAVQEAAYSDTVLGIIPQGTHNNFATALRLPQDLPGALRVLKDGEMREVDLGKCGDRYFTEAAGVGLFADGLALYGAGTNKSFARGLYAMSRVFLSMEARRLHVWADGKEVVHRSVMCTVANTYRIGAGVPIAPGARLTDDTLDVIVVGDLERSELIPYYRAFRAQLHLSLPKVHHLQAREVRIEARRRINVHVDDEACGTTPVVMTSQPAALKVMVDRL